MAKTKDPFAKITTNSKGEKFVDYKEVDENVKRIHSFLYPAYEELQSYRKKYKQKEAAFYNAFDYDFTEKTDTKKKGILRSHFISTGTEVFSSGMSFPNFDIVARSRKDVEARNKEAIAKALTEWGIRSSGFEEIYQKSKQTWIPFGDAYRRPFHKKKRSRTKRGNKSVRNLLARKDDKKYIVYEELDGRKVILDTSVKNVRSESDAESCNFWGYTDIYSEEALTRKFGQWILDYAKPGSLIDHDSLSIAVGDKDKKKTNYYEVIEYQNRSDETEAVLVGANGFPAVFHIEQAEELAIPEEIKEFVWWDNKYPHYNSYGEADITLHNNHMFWDSRGIRNLGLADKLYGPQIAHEIIENSKLDSTRKKMREIPVISGGRAQTITTKVSEWERRYESNIFSVLHLPSNVQNVVPQTSVIRFEGVSSEDGQRASQDVHDLGRNTAGISLNRLEVQQGIGVGQSEILEDEKIVSVERIVKNNLSNLRKEFTGILDYIVNMKGFELDEMITYEKYEEVEGVTRTLSYKIENAEISIKDAAKKLEEFEFDLYIDKNSIIEKRQVAMAEKIINFLGVVDPAAIPEVAKALMGRLAEVMRVDIPVDSLEGIENSRALGGRSQFQSTNQNPNENEPDQVNPEQALGGFAGGQGILSQVDISGAK